MALKFKKLQSLYENMLKCPASWVLFDYCDQANEFNVTKKEKEKQNDEQWWGANQRTEKSVDGSIKSS